MTELSIYSLVTRANVALNQTHKFEPGPFNLPKGQDQTDIYVYVRFNGGFTPSELIAINMVGWIVKEDTVRHAKWHGESVTWFDVLTNKISVDRSSVGNALYVVLNLAAGSAQEAINGLRKNFANVESWVNIAPSFRTNPTNPNLKTSENLQNTFIQPLYVENSIPQVSSHGSIELGNNYAGNANLMNQQIFIKPGQEQNQLYLYQQQGTNQQNQMYPDDSQSRMFMNQGQYPYSNMPNYPYGYPPSGQ